MVQSKWIFLYQDPLLCPCPCTWNHALFRLFLHSRFFWFFFFFTVPYRTRICVRKDEIAASVNVKMINVLCCRNVIIMGEIVRLPVFWSLIRTHTHTRARAPSHARTYTHTNLKLCIIVLFLYSWVENDKQALKAKCVTVLGKAERRCGLYYYIYLLTRLHSRLHWGISHTVNSFSTSRRRRNGSSLCAWWWVDA